MVHQKFSQQKQRGENINSYVPKTAKVLNSLQVLWCMVFLSLSWISVRTSAVEGTLMSMFSWPVNLSCPATSATDVQSARPDLASRVRQWVNVGEEALGSCLLGKCPLTALCWVFNTPLCNNICLFFFFFALSGVENRMLAFLFPEKGDVFPHLFIWFSFERFWASLTSYDCSGS